MNLRPLLGAVLLFVLSLVSSSPAFSQTLSDRENDGLRGPVSTVIEKTVTTKYSPDGKLLAPIRSFTSAPEADSLWRKLLPVGLPTVLGGGVPEGGKVTTLYDENNQATELQIHGADGNIIYKIVRTYDTNGRVIEEKIIWGNLAAYIPDNLSEEQRARLGGPEEFKRVVIIETAMMRGKAQVGAFYTFDEQNRLVKKVERGSVAEKTTTIIYNDQGDEAEEQIIFADNSALPSGVLLGVDKAGNAVAIEPDATPTPPAVREGYTVRYAYQYDSFGNWVQRTEIASQNQAEFQEVRNRTLSYYQSQ
jgi:hypothetical protein